jgi:hypothetical protein
MLAASLRDAACRDRRSQGRGLGSGSTSVPEAGEARAACERLMERGILAKDTHERTIRLAPPRDPRGTASSSGSSTCSPPPAVSGPVGSTLGSSHGRARSASGCASR